MEISLQSYADSLKEMLSDANHREALALARIKDLTAEIKKLSEKEKE